MSQIVKRLAPHAKFLAAVLGAAMSLVEGGRLVIEVRRRKSDGIQEWDIVSTDALEQAREAEAEVKSLLARVDEGGGGG